MRARGRRGQVPRFCRASSQQTLTATEILGRFHFPREDFAERCESSGSQKALPSWFQVPENVPLHPNLDARTKQRYIHFMPKDKRETANSIPFEF